LYPTATALANTLQGEAVAITIEYYGVSERRACRVLEQCRATKKYIIRKGQDHLRHHFIEELNSFQSLAKIADINKNDSLIYWKLFI
jgi:hypothetical protein